MTGAGYEVEMAIPFSSLRSPRTEGPQIWGLDALRYYPRNFLHRLSNNAKDRNVECYLCQLEKISGFAGAPSLAWSPVVNAVRTVSQKPSSHT